MMEESHGAAGADGGGRQADAGVITVLTDVSKKAPQELLASSMQPNRLGERGWNLPRLRV